jgi:hypothetical protein
MPLLGYLFIVTTYEIEITATVLIINILHNMKGTVYGNRLPKGYARDKRLGTAALEGKHNCEWQRAPEANER